MLNKYHGHQALFWAAYVGHIWFFIKFDLKNHLLAVLSGLATEKLTLRQKCTKPQCIGAPAIRFQSSWMTLEALGILAKMVVGLQILQNGHGFHMLTLGRPSWHIDMPFLHACPQSTRVNFNLFWFGVQAMLTIKELYVRSWLILWSRHLWCIWKFLPFKGLWFWFGVDELGNVCWAAWVKEL